MLIRHCSIPLGTVTLTHFTPSPLAALREAISTAKLLDERAISEISREQSAAVERGPFVSVVLCTKNREDKLEECLAALCRQDYPRFEIVVVDNTNGSDAVRRIADRYASQRTLRVVVEPHGGLARARNRGASVAQGTVIAYIDDDAVPSRCWIKDLAAGYVSAPTAAAVNGAILPAELTTEAQSWYLEYGGHSKGRGFAQALIDPAEPGAQDPLYPLPPFGAGGNMSVRREALLKVGGFDEALGAGTPSRGAEETALFTRLLLSGSPILYRPTAFVWHADRAQYSDLLAQMEALGTSLTAYYISMLLWNPRLVGRLIALIPKGIRDLRGAPGSIRTSTMSTSFPRPLMRMNRRGMILGPSAYLRSRWRLRGRVKALFESSLSEG